ncbi:histidine phosphatase family protein [Paraburkholderia sp. ZP32-5]|uniref:histidine phosphatase family protein n=1 Tax=Paraburkholderia sp. ZP32-5 TaxID=2883245 RepID=UPI001F449D93|nr:histidine phosphatase family protein [Paraburkholderia sp. ZP32-5]
MDTRLLLISRAATPAQRAGRFPADDPLDARGRAEAEAARARLALPTDAIAFVSPAVCARETAAALGLVAASVDALADMNYGDWRGRRLAEIVAEAPRELAAWTREPDAAPPSGESFSQLVRRVGTWLDTAELNDTASNAANEESGQSEAKPDTSTHVRTIVAVTHAPLLRAAIVYALGASPAVFSRIEIAPLSVVELRRSRRGWTWWPAAIV